MIVMSIPMTIISVLMVCVMLLVSKHVTNRSGRYFFAQQTNLGKVNGFIEEMMEDKKLLKSSLMKKKLNLILIKSMKNYLKVHIKQINMLIF